MADDEIDDKNASLLVDLMEAAFPEEIKRWNHRKDEKTTNSRNPRVQLSFTKEKEHHFIIIEVTSEDDIKVESSSHSTDRQLFQTTFASTRDVIAAISAVLEEEEEASSEMSKHELASSLDFPCPSPNENTGNNDSNDEHYSLKPLQQLSDYHWMSTDSQHLLQDRKSTFQAHLAEIHHVDQVADALKSLFWDQPAISNKVRRATHNMWAYRIVVSSSESPSNKNKQKYSANTTTIVQQDHSDDGEDGAGKKLAHLLEIRKESNLLVVVSRWYGGIHLGPKRFVHISNVARDLLDRYHEQQKACQPNSEN